MRSPVFRASGWGEPKIDLGGCVLYLPLWRPSSDMTGSTIYSYDTNRHTCTVNEATWGYQGRTFDGTDDYMFIPHNAAFTFSSVFTVEWWGRIDSYTADRSGIISKDRNDTNNWDFRPKTSTQIRFYYSYTDNTLITGLDDIGDLHHYAAVINGTDFKVYQDGSLKYSTTLSHAVGDNTKVILIGLTTDKGSATAYYTQCLIGEVRIYNRALSAPEVANNYQSTKWRYKT